MSVYKNNSNNTTAAAAEAVVILTDSTNQQQVGLSPASSVGSSCSEQQQQQQQENKKQQQQEQQDLSRSNSSSSATIAVVGGGERCTSSSAVVCHNPYKAVTPPSTYFEAVPPAEILDISNGPTTYVLCVDYFVCTTGKRPASILLHEIGGSNFEMHCYISPADGNFVIDYCTADTGIVNADSFLKLEPVTQDQFQVNFRCVVAPDSIIVWHDIGKLLEDLELQCGFDFQEYIDLYDWFAYQVSPSLRQKFTLAHKIEGLLQVKINESHDITVDANFIETLYTSFKDTPIHHPFLSYASKTLYDSLSKYERTPDPVLVVEVTYIPFGWTTKDILQNVVPQHCLDSVDYVSPVKWEDVCPGHPRGRTTVVFKNREEVRQMILRLHSNPEVWDWVVKREGTCYVNRATGVEAQEVIDPCYLLYVHSVPEHWTEHDVKDVLVPESLQQFVQEVKQTQYIKNKTGKRLVGRTHIIFSEPWCGWEMLEMIQKYYSDWTWSSLQEGSLLYTFTPANILVQPLRGITYEKIVKATTTAMNSGVAMHF